MKKYLAMAFALLAWAVAVLPYFLRLGHQVKENFWLFGVGVPLGWLLCVGLALFYNQGPHRKRWWVWLSAPFALGLWMFIWGLFWVTRGFQL